MTGPRVWGRDVNLGLATTQSPLDLSTCPAQGKFGQTLYNVLLSDPTPPSSSPRLGPRPGGQVFVCPSEAFIPRVPQKKPFVIRVEPTLPF